MRTKQNIIYTLLVTILAFTLGACSSATDGGETNSSTGTEQNTTVPTSAQDGTEETNSTTQTEAPALQSLKLTVSKTSLNKDENTTVKVEATYADKSSKEVTDRVAWVVTPSDAVKVTSNILTALQDKATTVKAKLNTGLSNTIDLNITWTVNGHTLPPEPDKALNDSTLLGIDSNNNGVRDDVERWIYETYKDKHPIYIDIAMQAGRAYKKVLETPERAKEIYPEVDKAADCEAYYKMDAKYMNEPLLVKEDIDSKYFRKKIYFNTKERWDAYIQYDTLLSGDTYILPSFLEEKIACDFNASKYKK